MAEIFLPLCGYDEEYLPDITVAAYLHDITKCRDDAWHESFLSDYMRGYHGYNAVYHSWSGAYFALTEYHCNPRVFRSVYSHTTGRADMDIFEKIIFLADYIDETRTYPSCVALREEFFGADPASTSDDERVKHLDRAALASIENTLSYLESKERCIHPLTLAARADLKARLGQ
jgi:HD superfamily phosphohydrolase YqeK